ncbi:hypothetical protein [Cupriavidus sp. D39]|uniref:hypothetical protein n=1 Tax=Cupriavidus sp. D39 TaxID=2997877 RepID=UPI00226D525D|nr:hypothetical protein [Cupriavidus sp. D39]MCY0857561.1 hypothetical protein [Cupriavidus sp. D39]
MASSDNEIFISDLIIWPRNSNNEIRTLHFVEDKVNVIHGRSRTGKSSVIAIIDYCLGASRCAIPVGTIREKAGWFGLQIRIRDTWIMVARRTPNNGAGSGECHISMRASADAPFPGTIGATHNLAQFKDAFNRIARVTNISLGDESQQGEAAENRPSYRDLAAFNFLPQHIVANPNILFYKSDSYKHKEKLKKVLPYALGIVGAEYLMKEREKARTQKAIDALMNEQEVRRRAFASWEADVRGIWNGAVELGMAQELAGATTASRVESLKALNEAFHSGQLFQRLQTPQYGYTNQLFREATELEEKEQKGVDDLSRELRDYERLSGRARGLRKQFVLRRQGW